MTEEIGARWPAHHRVVWTVHPYDLAYALNFAAYYFNLTGRHEEAMRTAEEAIGLSVTHGFVLWRLSALFELGTAHSGLGRPQEAIALLESTLAGWAAIGCRCYVCTRIGTLALSYAECGRPDEAMTTIDLAIRQAVEADDTVDLSRLHRIRAEIMAKSQTPDHAAIERELAKRSPWRRGKGPQCTKLGRRRGFWNS